MKNEDTQIGLNDLVLVLFVLVAGWMLIFQSNIF